MRNDLRSPFALMSFKAAKSVQGAYLSKDEKSMAGEVRVLFTNAVYRHLIAFMSQFQ